MPTHPAMHRVDARGGVIMVTFPIKRAPAVAAAAAAVLGAVVLGGGLWTGGTALLALPLGVAAFAFAGLLLGSAYRTRLVLASGALSLERRTLRGWRGELLRWGDVEGIAVERAAPAMREGDIPIPAHLRIARSSPPYGRREPLRIAHFLPEHELEALCAVVTATWQEHADDGATRQSGDGDA